MSLAKKLKENLALPVIGAPLFIIGNPDLVVAQCKAGIIGSFPALNARPAEELDLWLLKIKRSLEEFKKEKPEIKVAPFAVNQIIHASNKRLKQDMEACVKHEVPIIITSLSEPGAIVRETHSYGGLVFHDVISIKHAKKAIDAGVDGLILVGAGAGGHAGTLNPFAFVREVRRFFNGPIALSGAITDGAGILACKALGADFAYMGTRFIATKEARAVDAYKKMIVDSDAKDILYTPFFTGVNGNYLLKSIIAAGLDPKDVMTGDKSLMDFGEKRKRLKTWKDIWGAGQGVGNIQSVLGTNELVKNLILEYELAGKTIP
ncbi:MAG: nitronate monooxygenase [Proteobacteria bacterium]|nr:nitronate monooxygenase [Pseudomonadota bacterium]